MAIQMAHGAIQLVNENDLITVKFQDVSFMQKIFPETKINRRRSYS